MSESPYTVRGPDEDGTVTVDVRPGSYADDILTCGYPGCQDKSRSCGASLVTWLVAILVVGMVAGAAWLSLTTTGHGHHGPQIGTYPGCAYGVAHAYGSRPQCAMPEPAGDTLRAMRRLMPVSVPQIAQCYVRGYPLARGEEATFDQGDAAVTRGTVWLCAASGHLVPVSGPEGNAKAGTDPSPVVACIYAGRPLCWLHAAAR